MANPVLVEVLRGERVESRHRGAVAVEGPDGRLAFALGDVYRPIFPRSAIKAIQCLPLIETGAAERFGFGAAEIALVCASHSGTERHVAVAAGMLAKAGLDVSVACAVGLMSRCHSTRHANSFLAVSNLRRCTTIAPASTRACSQRRCIWASR